MQPRHSNKAACRVLAKIARKATSASSELDRFVDLPVADARIFSTCSFETEAEWMLIKNSGIVRAPATTCLRTSATKDVMMTLASAATDPT